MPTRQIINTSTVSYYINFRKNVPVRALGKQLTTSFPDRYQLSKAAPGLTAFELQTRINRIFSVR